MTLELQYMYIIIVRGVPLMTYETYALSNIFCLSL